MKNTHILIEAAQSSESLFGGSSFKWGGGPSDHGSRKLGNWQSDNAWDIMADVNTPVYSLNDGVVVKSYFAPYNGVIYGWQITIRGNDNDIFYTHLSEIGPKIKEGNEIKKGDLIGIIGKPTEKWPTHVHIGIGPDGKRNDISKYMETSGSFKNYTNSSDSDISSTISSIISSVSQGGAAAKDPILAAILNNMDYMTAMKESTKDYVRKYDYLMENKGYDAFGKNTYITGKDLTIPSSDNEKIKSPVNGIVKNILPNNSCKNQIGIRFKVNDKSYILEYCGIDDLSVSVGSNVSVGTKLGKTNSNVTVSLYDNLNQKLYIDELKEIMNKKNTKGERNPTTSSKDPLLAAILDLPVKLLGDKWASPTDPVQPPSWSVKWNPTRKVDENIERIKKLLK